ncbi:hypothetical protein D3C80_1156790 [compost metagenome]
MNNPFPRLAQTLDIIQRHRFRQPQLQIDKSIGVTPLIKPAVDLLQPAGGFPVHQRTAAAEVNLLKHRLASRGNIHHRYRLGLTRFRKAVGQRRSAVTDHPFAFNTLGAVQMPERCILGTAGQSRRIYRISAADLNRTLRITLHTAQHIDVAHGQIYRLRRKLPAKQLHQPADSRTVCQPQFVFPALTGKQLAQTGFRGIGEGSNFGDFASPHRMYRYRFRGRHTNQCNALSAHQRGDGRHTFRLVMVTRDDHERPAARSQPGSRIIEQLLRRRRRIDRIIDIPRHQNKIRLTGVGNFHQFVNELLLLLLPAPAFQRTAQVPVACMQYAHFRPLFPATRGIH